VRRSWFLIAALVLALAVPSSAMALAGGSTGSSGGGGGGSSSSSSSSSFSSSSGSSSSSTGGGTGGGGWVAGVIVLAMMGAFFAGAIGIFVVVLKNAQRSQAAGGGGAYAGRLIGNPFARRQRAQQVEAAARHAHAGDGYWEPEKLKQRVNECFYPIQWSWEKREVESSRPFVSDGLYERHKLQLDGLEKQFRRNRIADLALHEVELVRLHNVEEDNEDRFVAYVGCSARDWVEDVRTGAVVNGNAAAPTYFQQYWSFSRDGERGWVLDEIQQASEAQYHESAPIVDDDEGPPAKPANWYVDPYGKAKWRWWDGARWTDEVSD
jgi:Tim44-like domain/Protein of unknown function (DUF2510)